MLFDVLEEINRYFGTLIYTIQITLVGFFFFFLFPSVSCFTNCNCFTSSNLLYFLIRHIIHYLGGCVLIIRWVIFVSAD